MGWRGRREGGSGWGTHVNPWLIHVNVWQTPLQYCKVISLQLIKINEKKKKICKNSGVTGGRQKEMKRWRVQSMQRSCEHAKCLCNLLTALESLGESLKSKEGTCRISWVKTDCWGQQCEQRHRFWCHWDWKMRMVPTRHPESNEDWSDLKTTSQVLADRVW